MIELEQECIRVAPASGLWEAAHDAERGGLQSLSVRGDELVGECAFYIDDVTLSSAAIEDVRSSVRAGIASVESRGHFPFGNETRFTQVWRYAANHVRITCDLSWPRVAELNRRLSVGGLFLPGEWKRYYCLPPALHVASGWSGGWCEIPPPGEGPMMIGHWHRPPLALVFEREDGKRLEVGTGSDLWRWEACMGAPPENASYKIMLGREGIRVVREPLMCSLPFVPRQRTYRWTWHLAWDAPPERLARPDHRHKGRTVTQDKGRKVVLPPPGERQALCLDFGEVPWPESSLRVPGMPAYIRGEREPVPCWRSNATQKLARSLVRQLEAQCDPTRLIVQGLGPSPCWDSSHVQRRNRDGRVHWDLSRIMDFSVWTRQRLGPAWEIQLTGCRAARDLPSLNGLFAPSGF